MSTKYRNLSLGYVASCIFCMALICGPNEVRAEPAETEVLTKEDAQKRLEESQKNLQSSRQKEVKITKNLDHLSEDRGRLNASLIEMAGRIQASERRLSKAENRLGELSEQETLIKGSIEQRHDSLANVLGVMQRMGRQPPPIMSTHRDDALKMVRSAMLLAHAFPHLRGQAKQLSKELSNLVQVRKTIKVQAQEHREEYGNLSDDRVRVKALLIAKKSRILVHQEKLKTIQIAVKQYTETITNLSELIIKLDQEVSEKSALGQYDLGLAALDKPSNEDKEGGNDSDRTAGEERLAENEPNTNEPNKDEAKTELIDGPQQETQTAILFSPARIKPALPFSQSKGLLRLPVQGETILKYGDPGTFGTKTKGLSIKTRKDAQITSPGDGWVVYAGLYRSYRQLLIINTGGGYHILLAGMGHIDVNVGQFVLSGEPVATMGDVQPIADDKKSIKTKDSFPILYVEFRKDGRSIDPDPWWSRAIEKAEG